MKKIFTISIAILILSLFFGGCVSRLLIKDMIVEPSPASRGDEVSFYVMLNKPSEEVETVKAVVREYPEFTFTLNNNGEGGDVKECDNIWSSQETIPWNAPSQTFHIDVSILNGQGNLIIKEEVEGKTLERSGTILLLIEY